MDMDIRLQEEEEEEEKEKEPFFFDSWLRKEVERERSSLKRRQQRTLS